MIVYSLNMFLTYSINGNVLIMINIYDVMNEHFDHEDDLEKCGKCGGVDLTFYPKVGNQCDACGYKEWEDARTS